MAHMPSYTSSGSWSSTQTAGPARIVTYIATGLEGVDFFVPIGTELASEEYDVGFFGAAGAAIIPAVWDFPEADPADRTASQFRVLIPAPLQAGDRFKFAVTSPTITVSSTFEPDDDCACSGGGGEIVVYIAVGGEDDFMVALPSARTDADYSVDPKLAGVDAHVTIDVPLAGRTTTQFQVLTSAPLTAGDRLEFTVEEL